MQPEDNAQEPESILWRAADAVLTPIAGLVVKFGDWRERMGYDPMQSDCNLDALYLPIPDRRSQVEINNRIRQEESQPPEPM